MARTRKSHKRGEEVVKTTASGLEVPRDQPGKNPWVIYCDYKREDSDISRVLVQNFAARYAAHYFLKLVMGDEEWVDADPIGSRECIQLVESGVRISMYGNDLKDLIDYEPIGLETEYTDEQLIRYVNYFKYARNEESTVVTDPQTGQAQLVKGKKEAKREKREKKEPKPKIDKTGLVSANDIAKELGVEGREVRGVLRAMKLEKPVGGWLFDKKTAEEIRDKVKKGLKQAKEKKKDKKK